MQNSKHINQNKKNPAISVIVPCYNHGEFINETIESVLGQTFKDYEIIVVDDGSTDEKTVYALEKLKNTYPNINIIHQPNGGPANARNNGIKLSRGEFILPLDSDDTIEPQMLEKCHKILSADPELGFVYTYTHFFGGGDLIWKNPEYNFYDILWSSQSTVSALVRKKAWEEVGGFDEDPENGFEDWEFWINLGAHGWFGKVLKEPLFNYRKAGEARVRASELKYNSAVGFIRRKHRRLYSRKNIRKIKKIWRPWTAKNIFFHFDSRLEGAGLYDRDLWKQHPVVAVGRLVPVRVKRKINSFFQKRIFDTSYYHRSGE